MQADSDKYDHNCLVYYFSVCFIRLFFPLKDLETQCLGLSPILDIFLFYTAPKRDLFLSSIWGVGRSYPEILRVSSWFGVQGSSSEHCLLSMFRRLIVMVESKPRPPCIGQVLYFLYFSLVPIIYFLRTL